MRTKNRPYYLLRPRLRGEALGMLDMRSVVSKRAGYVYLRVPKAANSTVLRALLEHAPEPGVDAADVARAKSRVPHLSDLRFHDLPWLRRAFVFTIVRNPYARTLSAYLDKFRDEARLLDKFGVRVAGFDGGAVTFRGFCRYLAEGGEAENGHWARQTRFAALADRLDFVGRVETLEADLGHILTRLGVTERRPTQRAGPPRTDACRQISRHYDDETRRLVERVYAADFAAFGYRPGELPA
jgi:hypothetical protein